MIPSAFDYVAPESVADALTALADGGEDAKILAGGQSLIPVLRLRMAAPGLLIDLRKIPELHGVSLDGDQVVIGAMTTHHEVATHPLIAEHLSLLAKTAETVADPQVRHRGTFGGALAHADPAGDLGAVAVALDATFEIAGPDGNRSVPASEFFSDYFTTALAENEILTAITADGSTVTDLHVWQLGPGHHGAIVAIETSTPRPPSHYRQKLSHLRELSHVTIQVEPA